MPTVLLIDDDAQVRGTVGRALQSAGYEVIEAADGNAGIQAFDRRRPDLVITDIIMPTQEGIETIVRIRAVSSVPIIAVSGYVGADHFEPLRDARLIGASLTLAKPIRSGDLIAAVRNLLAAGGTHVSP